MNFGDILSSAASGAGAGLLSYGKMMEEDIRAKSTFDANVKLAEVRQEMEEKARKAQGEARATAAKDIAAQRGGSIDPAEEAYRNATPTDGGAPYLERPEVKEGLLSARREATTPTGRDYLQADVNSGVASGEKLADYDQKDKALADSKSDRLQGLLDKRDAETLRNDENKRYHDMMYGPDGARRKGGGGGDASASATSKLPEATKMQVSSILRTNEKLETRYYALKEGDFQTPESYKAERDSLKAQIAENERKVMRLVGAEDAPPKDRPPLSSFGGKKAAPAEAKSEKTTPAPAKSGGVPQSVIDMNNGNIRGLKRDVVNFRGTLPPQR